MSRLSSETQTGILPNERRKNSFFQSDTAVLTIDNIIERPTMKKKVHKTNVQNLYNSIANLAFRYIENNSIIRYLVTHTYTDIPECKSNYTMNMNN